MKPPKQLTVAIANKDDADRSLKEIAFHRSQVDARTAETEIEVGSLRAKLVKDCNTDLEIIAAHELALEAWAEQNKESLFKDPRSMQLNFGTIGFHLTPWKIVILGRLKVETIIEKMRAARMKNLIRVKEEIDREKALNYLNSDLAKCGLKKTRKDEFYYELKTEEVK